MTQIRCPLQEAAQISGKLPALIREGLTLNYSQLDALVSATTRRLRRVGVEPGERVGLFLQSDWMYPVIFWSLLRAGAVACPLNTRVPREGLKKLIDIIDCRKLISVVRGGEKHKQLWGLDIYDPESLIDGEGAGIQDDENHLMDLERPATVVFTSGSTGTARAVVHSYGNHYYNAKGSNTHIRLGSGERWLLTLPLYHVSGLGILFRCLLAGAAVVMSAQDEEIGAAVAKYQATHVSLVATQLLRMLQENRNGDSLSHLHAVLVGGGPVPPSLVDQSRKSKIPLFTTYGLTEMASQVTTTRLDTPPARRHTSGTILKYRDLKIGPRNEILVKGDTLCRGFLQNGRVELPVDPDGWYATGDTGFLDEEGYLSVTGRLDNMFVSGGENIFPEEIEQALAGHEAVQQAVVVPVPDQEFGFRPVAFVRFTDQNGYNLAEFRPFLEPLLPRFKIPIAFYAWPEEISFDELKVDRRYFAEQARKFRAIV